MKTLAVLVLAALVSACGGGGVDAPTQAAAVANQSQFVASHIALSPSLNSVTAYWGPRSNYSVTVSADGFYVLLRDQVGADEQRMLSINATLQFSDVSLAFTGNDGDAAKVSRLFRAALGRDGDAAGVGYWMHALSNGGTLTSLAKLFIGSSEFKSRYGSSTSGPDLVRLMYANVLAREPDAAGLQYWTTYLANNSPEALLVQFSESAELKTRLAPIFAAGIAFLPVDPIALPLGRGSMPRQYFSGVRSGYRITDVANYTEIVALQGQDGRTEKNIASVAEFTDTSVAVRAEDTRLGAIYRLYKATFGRVPDPNGIGYWLNSSDKGLTLSSMAEAFMLSREFGERYGSAVSNDAFIELLYQNVLLRGADPAGKSYWTSFLASGGARAAALLMFSESPENKVNALPGIRAGVTFNLPKPSAIVSGIVVQRLSTLNVLDENFHARITSNCGQYFSAMDVASDGRLFGISNISKAIYVIDPVKAACSKVGDFAASGIVTSLAISPQGTGYVISGGYVNPATGFLTKGLHVISNITGSGPLLYRTFQLTGASDYVFSIDMAPDGELYGYAIVSGGYGLVKVDKFTGVVSLAGPITSFAPINYDIDIDTAGIIRGISSTGQLVSYQYRTGEFKGGVTPTFVGDQNFDPIAVLP